MSFEDDDSSVVSRCASPSSECAEQGEMMDKVKKSGFFVMIRHQKGFPVPMVDEEGNVKLFDTEAEAEQAGKKNLFGETFGYEVYRW